MKNIKVFKNGQVFTANAKHEYVSAFAVRDGKFIYVGDEAGVREYEKDADIVVDLNGATVTPGLIEGHNHFTFMAALYSMGYEEIPENIVTPEAALAEVEKFVAQHPNSDVYVLGNFSQGFDMGAAQLDEICREKPIVCVSMGLHGLYVNSAFLEAGNITKETKDVIPGQTYYVRNDDGTPTGKIVELPQSWDAFQKAMRPDNGKIKDEFLKLQGIYHSFGCTGITDCGFLGLNEEDMLRNITELEEEGKLNLVVSTSSIWYGKSVSPLQEIESRALKNKKNYTTQLVHPGMVKMWVDGTLGALTALMREPYQGTDTRGVRLSTVEDLTDCAKMCNRNDLNMHIHAIGDRAIEDALTAYEAAGRSTGVQSIAHFEISPPDIIERAARINGLVLSMTPSWNTTLVPEEVEPVGERRNTYGLFKEAMDAGITVNFGSDSNGSVDLWYPTYIMVFALKRDPKEETIILKGTGCSFEQAIEAYSINAAKQTRIDDSFGSIEKGKFADFAVWDMGDMSWFKRENIATVLEAWKVGKLFHVVKTYFHGKEVYREP